jgi:hypothetical protein
MSLRDVSRIKATTVHFGFSLALAAGIFLLFWFVWYPMNLFWITGAAKLMLLVVTVDVVLGPLLTLVAFNPKKKSLYWDMAFIIAMQLAALVYGVWVTWQQRPVFLVGAVDRYVLVAANEIAPEDLAKAKPEYANLSFTGPVLVGAGVPENTEEQNDVLFSALEGGADIDRLPATYRPVEAVAKDLLSRSSRFADWDRASPNAEREKARAWVKEHGLYEGTVRLLPLQHRKGFATLVLEAETAKPLMGFDFDSFDPPNAEKAKASGAKESEAEDQKPETNAQDKPWQAPSYE